MTDISDYDGMKRMEDMCPPQPTEHPDIRMHLRLRDVWEYGQGEKVCYRLVYSGRKDYG
jgi:hypothetical protein